MASLVTFYGSPRVISAVQQFVHRAFSPLRHDPAWFELASIMGAVGWAGLGLLSDYRFDDWPSMLFVSQYIGSTPLYIALFLGVVQGIAVFGDLPEMTTRRLMVVRFSGWTPRLRVEQLTFRLAITVRACSAFLASWWWFYLGLGIASSLPAINMHVALYVVMGVINLMVMARLALDSGRSGDG